MRWLSCVRLPTEPGQWRIGLDRQSVIQMLQPLPAGSTARTRMRAPASPSAQARPSAFASRRNWSMDLVIGFPSERPTVR